MTLVRPEFLLLLLIWLPATFVWLRRRPLSSWHRVMDPDLFEHLKKASSATRFRNTRWSLPLFLLLLILAMSGPAMERTSSATLSQGNLYVVLDNTLSMAIEDVSPNRLTRAKRLIIDWSRSGLFDKTMILTYSGSAHVLTPLTADAETLELQLQSLTPYIMPEFGNRPDLAFEKLTESLIPGQNHLLWLTDEVPPQSLKPIRQKVSGFTSRSLVALGTEQGGPIPLPNDQGYLQQDGSLVVVATDHAQFRDSADALGFNLLSPGEQPRAQWFDSSRSRSDQSGIQSQDLGYWLLIPMLLIWGLSRRQALIPAVLLVLLTGLPNPQPPMAATLFQNTEQQAYRAYAEGDYERAEQLSENPMLLGESLFQQGDYEQAAQAFGQSTLPDAHFNRGNALAHAGRYEEAIEAYDQALATGAHPPARQNKSILESFLKDQEASEQNQPGDNASENDPNTNAEGSPQEGDGRSEPPEEPQPSTPADAETESPSSPEEAPRPSEQSDESAEESAQATEASQPDQPSAEELRAQQETDAILNRLESPSGSLLQQKFRFQHQQNPTEPDGTLW